MTIEARLANMRKYREEALKHPRANKLYIEDLDLSIAMFEKQLVSGNKLIIQQGWIDNE